MFQIFCGDALDVLKTLNEKSVRCCITSPPYYWLRDYGIDKQIGMENTVAEYIDKLVSVFHEVKRVLTDDGTLWVIPIYKIFAGVGIKMLRKSN